MDRRSFLAAIGTGLGLMAAPGFVRADGKSSEQFMDECSNSTFCGQNREFWNRPRNLWLRRGSEEIRLTYWRPETGLDWRGYMAACYMLRDIRANAWTKIDTRLLDIMRAEQGWLEAWGNHIPMVIHSGYRTKKTNDLTEGSAKNSKHLEGRAVDKHMSGIPTKYQGRLAYHLQAGGVGIYISRNFIHTDTGNVRHWVG